MLNLVRSKSFLLFGSVVVLTVLAIALLRPGAGVAGQPPDTGPTDAYDFPIKPGTPEWAALKSHEEMLQVCQVPESILQEMSTEGLIETCLNYPLYGDMLAYNSMQQGFDAVVSRFNGLQELLKREDAGSKLLARYRKMDPETGENWTPLRSSNSSLDFTFIEMLLAQDDILSKLTPAERRDLLAVSLEMVRSKQKHADIYSLFGQERTALIMGRILQMENFDAFNRKVQENETLQVFLGDGEFAGEKGLNDIFLQTQRFLSQYQ
ncbi:MAG: hypothetical protein SVX38_05200 [Chloroflexota bacterium]|nr:hypothetical protein [Chloroflexota bacterium]